MKRTVDGGCANATVRHGYVRSTEICTLGSKVLGRSNKVVLNKVYSYVGHRGLKQSRTEVYVVLT